MVAESASPDGLRERAKIMRNRKDESCARHLELAADRIDELQRVMANVAQHPIDFVLSAQTWRMIFQDIQQLCHKASTQPNFSLREYEPDEDWPPVGPVRMSRRQAQQS